MEIKEKINCKHCDEEIEKGKNETEINEICSDCYYNEFDTCSNCGDIIEEERGVAETDCNCDSHINSCLDCYEGSDCYEKQEKWKYENGEKSEKFFEDVDKIEKFLDENNLVYSKKSSNLSCSTYFEIEKDGKEISVRFSDHVAKPTYQKLNGFADFEIGFNEPESFYAKGVHQDADGDIEEFKKYLKNKIKGE